MQNGTFTFDSLVAYAKGLTPEEGTRYTDPRMMAPHVATPVITQIYDRQGNLVVLDQVNGKYAIGYIRVSHTVALGEDGQGATLRDSASDEQQIRQVMEYFVYTKKWQFRLVSDVNLKGDYPWLDAELIRDMREERARRYEDAYRKFLLNDASIQSRGFSPEQVARMERYLARTIAHIKDQVQEVTPGERKRRHNRAKSLIFRPGLTVVMDGIKHVHAIVAYEDSRLVRSYVLDMLLGRRLAQANVQVITFSGVACNSGSRKFEDVLTGAVMAIMAERKLTEVTENALRGYIAKISRGEAIACIPWWLKRGKTDKHADFKPGALEVVEKILSLYRGTEGTPEKGYRSVAVAMDKLGIPGPSGKTWNQKTIRDTLTNPALLGICDFMGVEWNIYPAVLDRETFNAIRDRLHERGKIFHLPAPEGSAHLLTGLLKCTCGRNTHFQSTGKFLRYSVSTSKVANNRPEGHEHIAWNARDAEQFFDSIMRYCPQIFCNVAERTAEHVWLEDHLAELRAQLDHLEDQRGDYQQRAQEDAQKAINLAPSSPRYQRTLQALIDSYTGEYEDQLTALRQEIETTERRHAELPSPTLVLSIRERAQRWDSLSLPEKNKLLNLLIREIRLEGDSVVVVTRFDVPPLDPIPLKTLHMRNGRTRRRFPQPEDWETFRHYLPTAPTSSAKDRWTTTKQTWAVMTEREHNAELAYQHAADPHHQPGDLQPV